MGEKDNMEILLEIQNTLGTVVEATSSIKKDIVELKEKDLRQSDDLEKAYEKAKARQDSIRDDLQHQIDNDRQLITDIKSSIDSLSNSITKVIDDSKKTAEHIIKEQLEKYDKRFENIESEIKNIKDEKKNFVFSWWGKIVEKLLWIGVAVIFAAIFSYCNITPPKLPI